MHRQTFRRPTKSRKADIFEGISQGGDPINCVDVSGLDPLDDLLGWLLGPLGLAGPNGPNGAYCPTGGQGCGTGFTQAPYDGTNPGPVCATPVVGNDVFCDPDGNSGRNADGSVDCYFVCPGVNVQVVRKVFPFRGVSAEKACNDISIHNIPQADPAKVKIPGLPPLPLPWPVP